MKKEKLNKSSLLSHFLCRPVRYPHSSAKHLQVYVIYVNCLIIGVTECYHGNVLEMSSNSPPNPSRFLNLMCSLLYEPGMQFLFNAIFGYQWSISFIMFGLVSCVGKKNFVSYNV